MNKAKQTNRQTRQNRWNEKLKRIDKWTQINGETIDVTTI